MKFELKNEYKLFILLLFFQKKLFTFLMKRCNRNDIRNVFILSHDWFADPDFLVIRQMVYSYPDKKINSKTLQLVSEVSDYKQHKN